MPGNSVGFVENATQALIRPKGAHLHHCNADIGLNRRFGVSVHVVWGLGLASPLAKELSANVDGDGVQPGLHWGAIAKVIPRLVEVTL